MALFWTSDPHYFHGNIIKYCNRPFENWWEMNETLIRNHNAVVRPDDEIWLLGDISFGQPNKTEEVLKRLNGRKHLIYGNHDKEIRKKPFLQAYFETIQEYKELSVSHQGKNYFIVMCHYPFETWNRSGHGSWNFHGHVHSRFEERNRDKRRLDVGVDTPHCRFFPISLSQIINIMDKKEIKNSENY